MTAKHKVFTETKLNPTFLEQRLQPPWYSRVSPVICFTYCNVLCSQLTNIKAYKQKYVLLHMQTVHTLAMPLKT